MTFEINQKVKIKRAGIIGTVLSRYKSCDRTTCLYCVKTPHGWDDWFYDEDLEAVDQTKPEVTGIDAEEKQAPQPSESLPWIRLSGELLAKCSKNLRKPILRDKKKGIIYIIGEYYLFFCIDSEINSTLLPQSLEDTATRALKREDLGNILKPEAESRKACQGCTPGLRSYCEERNYFCHPLLRGVNSTIQTEDSKPKKIELFEADLLSGKQKRRELEPKS